MPYTHTTLDAAAAAVAAKLSDVGSKFWPPTEQHAAIREALRIVNALTGRQRARGIFNATAGTAVYALPPLLQSTDDGGELLRARTVTDAALVAEIRHQLVEVSPTSQFSTGQIVDALEGRRDALLAETGCVVTEAAPISVEPNSAGHVALPETIIAIRRAIWVTTDGRYSTLSVSDEHNQLVSGRSASAAGRPRTYSVSATAPMQLKLSPPPSMQGELRLLAVEVGAVLDRTQAVSTLIGVPDDLSPFVKWGAIADLLLGVESLDPERSAIAERMYGFGRILGANMPVILSAEINGLPTRAAAVHNTDRMRNGWQGMKRGRPDTLSIAGPELILLTPVPDSPRHSVTLDVVRNAIVPAEGEDLIQLPREQMEMLYELAEWILRFKLYDSSASTALMQQFLSAAGTWTRRNRAAGRAIHFMYGISQQQRDAAPIEDDADPPPAADVNDPDEVLDERNARRRLS